MTAIRNFKTNEITITNDGDNYKNESALINALYALEDIDTYMIGEGYCLSNVAEGCTIYSAFSDMCYILDITALTSLPLGGKMTLTPRIPDEYDREILAREYTTV